MWSSFMTMAWPVPLALAAIWYPTAVASQSMDCAQGLRHFDPLLHKETYNVGVHAPGGIDVALREYNLTFQEYLTATAGQRFDPPIDFKMVPTNTPLYSWIDGAEEEEIDFYFSDSGVYSCVGVEIGAQPVATTVANLNVRGHEFKLDMFAGVIFTLAERDDIASIGDLRDKTIGALEIGDFAGAQVQFYSMAMGGMDYIMDPKQVIFTGNQLEIIRGVLRGDWEVGFVRTGLIERMVDEDGEAIDPNIFKVIDPKIYVLDDGNLFPFLHSTPVFPEWPVYANQHTPRDVIEEVQQALFALGSHHVANMKLDECAKEFSEDVCNEIAIKELMPDARCDTTRELAKLAEQSSHAGNHDGFRSPRSYFNLRTMQQRGGFLNADKKGNWKCTRAETLRGAINCPEGHYLLSEEAFEKSCSLAGEECPEGLSCYCDPCIKAFEVNLYEIQEDETREIDSIDGCDKMSLCASVQQTKTISFRAHDNKERQNADVQALMHIGQAAIELDIRQANESWTYEFDFMYPQIGIGILEFFVDGEQIPQSPIRVQVIDRDCDLDYPGESRVPANDGSCMCSSDTVQIGTKCVSSVVFFSSISAGLVFIVLVIGFWYIGYKKRQSDQMWLVNVEELHFSDPVEVIGQGSFGVVLAAEYRGTKVAIKRVLPPNDKKKASKSGSKGSGSKDGGSRDSRMSETGGSLGSNGKHDVEAQDPEKANPGTASSGSMANRSFNASGSMSLGGGTDSNLDFLHGLSFGHKRTRLQIMFPWCFPEDHTRHKINILGNASGGSGNRTSKTFLSHVCPWLDKQSIQKQEFIMEMRLLSRLRHPCITTVMGAVISPVTEPMLVMEFMEYGSLHDLLRNETMYTGGEIILQICRDIAQGLRYLHASKPPILHGDLKARNILIDSRFRAKVADFGLSTKKQRGLCGTPFFLAPEYLRGKSEYNDTCDIYSTGIILYEIYARKEPYEGENPRQVLRKVCDPRVNKRPAIPECCPTKMADIMKKCWSPDPFFRPQAKDLDVLFMDMNMQEAEPNDKGELMFNKPKEITTEDMLYEVFPRHIADALKAGQKVEPESHENVTVVFSDIVHFTDISKTISPLKVSMMLDRLYLAFDAVARKHHVFKVETIGDAYMGVTNLDGTEDNTHVKQVAEFAIDLVEAAGTILIDEEEPQKGYIKVRLGFHSGPVVSNVIGSLNPRYGLFGDTVNTASRMESSSYSRRIHCSERSAKLLAEQAPDVPLIKRGKIGIKGKGEMTTYWVGTPSMLAAGQSEHGQSEHAE